MNGRPRLQLAVCIIGLSACGYAPLPEVDRDEDGIPDHLDNCPDDKNPDQINEDGDRLGDACDPCPQIPEDAAIDSDGDHIGDICDPNPGFHDTVWRYEGFHNGLPVTGLRSVHWTAVGDTVQTIADNTTVDGEYLFTPFAVPTQQPDKFSATMTVWVNQTIGPNDDHSVGIQVEDNGTGTKVDCGLVKDSASVDGSLFLKDSGGFNLRSAFAWKPNVEYWIAVTRHGLTYTCSASGPGGAPYVSSVSDLGGAPYVTGTSNVTPVDDHCVNIWAHGAIATYGSVQIIGTP